MSAANMGVPYAQVVAGLCDGREQPLLVGGGLGPGVGTGAGAWVVGGGGGRVVVGGRITGMTMGVREVGVVTGVGCDGIFSVMTLPMRLQAAKSPAAKPRPGIMMRTLFRKAPPLEVT